MKKNISLLTVYIGSVFAAYVLGSSYPEEMDQALLEKLTAQNQLLKNQLNYLQASHIQKDKEYLRITKQLLELDKKLIEQQQNEQQLFDEINQLAQQKPTAATGMPEPFVDMDMEIEMQSATRWDSNGEISQVSSTSSAAKIENDVLPPQDNKNQTFMDDPERRLSLTPRRKMPPTVFRTSIDIDLVDVDYQVRESWKQGRSFTAKEKYGQYYKVSGYFVNKKWTGAKDVLLIPIDKSIRH